jgi:hypothetical protein
LDFAKSSAAEFADSCNKLSAFHLKVDWREAHFKTVWGQGRKRIVSFESRKGFGNGRLKVEAVQRRIITVLEEGGVDRQIEPVAVCDLTHREAVWLKRPASTNWHRKAVASREESEYRRRKENVRLQEKKAAVLAKAKQQRYQMRWGASEWEQ